MMGVQAGYKLTEFGRQQQSESNKKLSEISGERDKIVSQLFKIGKTKNLKLQLKCSSETYISVKHCAIILSYYRRKCAHCFAFMVLLQV